MANVTTRSFRGHVAPSVLVWYGKEVEWSIRTVMSLRLDIVGGMLKEKMEQKVSRPGGLNNRSKPGEPPKTDTHQESDYPRLVDTFFSQRLTASGWGKGTVKGMLVQMIGSTSPVAKWQELGTGPGHHMADPMGIGLNPPPQPNPRPEAKGDYLMKWDDYGEWHSAKSTAGIKRRPFMAVSLHEMIDDIVSTLCAEIVTA